MLLEDTPVWPKLVAHKQRMYIYLNDILNTLKNILVTSLCVREKTKQNNVAKIIINTMWQFSIVINT
jgi:hypothetical protein